MSMWSLRWHFTNKSVAGAPYSIKRYSYSLSHSRTLRWRIRWLKQWRLKVAAELQQRWRRTNRRRKSIPRSSSSHREGSITQRGASCGSGFLWVKLELELTVSGLFALMLLAGLVQRMRGCADHWRDQVQAGWLITFCLLALLTNWASTQCLFHFFGKGEFLTPKLIAIPPLQMAAKLYALNLFFGEKNELQRYHETFF